ncbi:MAG: orotidine-5'-phosphate decarboxylase [Chloroflexia bacterium]
MTSFNDRLDAAIKATDSLLCVGLDPIYAELPERFRDGELGGALLGFNRYLADATAEYAVAFKLQMKIYTAEGPEGYAAMIETCRYLKAAYPDHLLILDAKYGDVGHVVARVAEEAFDRCGADAVTAFAHPGREALAPLLARPDRGCFVVCRTSNPGAAEMQDVEVVGGEPYYVYMARRLAAYWNEGANCGIVAGATWPAEMAAIREAAPNMPILAPGIGAQGGDLAGSVSAGMNRGGGGLLISASRGLMQAADTASAAAGYVAAIRAARAASPLAPQVGEGPLDALLVALFDAGIIKFERITLKSGLISPYYHNLRALVAHPALLRQVAAAYAARVRELGQQPEILLGIAYAGIPLAVALGQALDIPAGYIRAEAKSYGTKQMVEGPWKPGLCALLIDDVISDGATKLEVLPALRDAGLDPTDMLVFVDRGQGGLEKLRAAGMNPQAVTTMAHTLRALRAAGRISDEQVRESEEFMTGSAV